MAFAIVTVIIALIFLFISLEIHKRFLDLPLALQQAALGVQNGWIDSD
jgi:hypothetical protein